MGVTRCLLQGMYVPKPFWHMTVLTATYLINHVPSRILGGKSPVSVLQPEKPLFSIPPKVFGCVCFVQNRSPSQTKLDNNSIRCAFVGYSSTSKGYRCYDPSSRRILNSLDVTFWEDTPFFVNHTSIKFSSPTIPTEDVPSPIPILDTVSPIPILNTMDTLVAGTPELVNSRHPHIPEQESPLNEGIVPPSSPPLPGGTPLGTVNPLTVFHFLQLLITQLSIIFRIVHCPSLFRLSLGSLILFPFLGLSGRLC